VSCTGSELTVPSTTSFAAQASLAVEGACGELFLAHPYQQVLVACLECERVFVYSKLDPGVATGATPPLRYH